MRRYLIPLTIAATIGVYAATGIPAENILTLQEAIRMALVNNTTYRIAQEKTHESSIKVRETWGQLWPTLSTDVSETRMWAEKGINAIQKGAYTIDFVKGSIAVNPGVFYNSLKEAREGHIASVSEERNIRADTTIHTIQLYYRLLLADEIIKLRSDSLRALEENLKAVTTGYKGGVYTKLDFLRAKVSTANEKTRLIIANNDYQRTQAALNIQIGREIDASLEPDVREVMTHSSEAETYARWSDSEKKGQYNFMLIHALENRPELLVIKAKQKAALARARANESVYLWPTLFASGSYGTNKIVSKPFKSTGDPQIDKIVQPLMESFVPSGWNKNWNITVGATYRWGALSPFDSTHAKGEEHRSQVRQVDMELEEFTKVTRLDIKMGILKLFAASNAILSQKENIKSAEESLRVAILQFRNGVIDNTKLLDANVELASAKTMYYQSLYEFQTAKAELNRAIGIEYFSFPGEPVANH